MQTYSATIEGKTYTVRGDVGKTQEEVEAAIRARLSDPSLVNRSPARTTQVDTATSTSSVPTLEEIARLREERTKEYNPEGNLIGSALKRGAGQFVTGYGSGIEGLFGLEDTSDIGYGITERAGPVRQEEFFGTGIKDKAYYVAERAAESAPIMAPGILAGGIAGAAVGTGFFGIGSIPGFLIGAGAAALTQVPLFYGFNRERQKEEIAAGRKTQIDESAAFLYAIPQAALEGIADRLLIGVGITPKVLANGGLFTRAAKGVGTGFVTESATEIGQQILERKQAGLDLFSDEAIAEYKKAGLDGGLVGGSIRGTANLFQRDTTDLITDIDTLADADAETTALEKNKELKKLEKQKRKADKELADELQKFTGVVTPETESIDATQERVRDRDEAAIDKIFFPEEGDIDGTKEGTSGVGVSDDPKSAVIEETATGPVSAEGTGTSGTAGVAADQPDVRRVDDREVGDDSALKPSPIPYSELSREEKAEFTKAPLAQKDAKLVEIAKRRAKITEPEPTQVDTLSPEETIVAYVNNEKTGRENVVKKIQESPELSKRATTGLPEGDTIPVYRFIKYNEKTKPKQEELISGSLTPEGSAAFIRLATQRTPEVSKNRVGDVQRVIRYDVPRKDIKAYLPALADSLEQKHNKKVKGVGIGKALQFSKKIENPVDNAKKLIGEQGEVFADVSNLKGRVLKYGDTGKTVDFNKLAASNITNIIRDGEVKTPEDFNKLGITRLPLGSTPQQETKARQDLINEVRSFYNLDQKKTTEKKEPAVASVYPKPLKSLLKETKIAPATVKGKKRVITKEKPVALAESVQEVDARTETTRKLKGNDDTAKLSSKIISAVEGVEASAIDARIKERKTRQKADSIIARTAQFFNTPETTPKIKTLKDFTRTYGDDMEGLGTPVQKSRLLQNKINTLDKNIEAQTKEMAENKELTNEDRVRMDVLKATRNEAKKQLQFEKQEAETLEADPLTAKDIDKVTQLIGKKLPERVPSKDPKKKSDVNYEKKVQEFFSRTPSVLERLLAAAQDIALSPPTINTTKNGVPLYDDLEIEIYRGTGSNLGKQVQEWVNKNLSKEVQTWFEGAIQSAKAGNRIITRGVIKRDKADIEAANLADQIATEYDDAAIEAARKQELNLPIDEVTGVDIPLHNMVLRALSSGNLKNTLLAIGATNQNKKVSNIAERMAELVGTTKLKVVEGLKSAGSFDPKTNTIKLNADYGLNNHTILHEMTHAIVSTLLANKSHPVTKRLNTLYNEMKSELESEYGVTSLDEFVAEAFSNVQFQQSLAQYVPKASPYSLWQQFKRTIQNFFLPADQKIPFDVYTEVDRLTNSLMAPAPRYRNAGEMYMALPKKAERVFDDAVDKNTKNSKKVTTEADERTAIGRNVDKVIDGISIRTPKSIRGGMLGVLTLKMVSESRLAKKHLPSMQKLYTTAVKQAGELDRLNRIVDNTSKRITKFGKSNPKLFTTLTDLQNIATLNGVNFARPESTYKNNPKKLALYKKYINKFNSLGGEGKKIYNIMLQMEKQSFDRIRELFLTKIEAAGGKKVSKQLNELYTKLIADFKEIEPYFSLRRSGEFWIEYNASDPLSKNKNERFSQAFDTSAERNKAVKLLRKNKNKVGLQGDVKILNRSAYLEGRSGQVSGKFTNEILQIISEAFPNPSKADNKIVEELKNDVVELFLDRLPEQSALKALKGRKGVRGFIGDVTPLSVLQEKSLDKNQTLDDYTYAPNDTFHAEVLNSFINKHFNMNRQFTQLKYNNELTNIDQKINKEFKTATAEGNLEEADSNRLAALKEEADDRSSFIRNPNIRPYSKAFTSFGFAWTLGANISSATINSTNIPIVVYPTLSSEYGADTSMYALGRAAKTLTGTIGTKFEESIDENGNIIKTKAYALPGLDNIDFDNPKNKDIKYLEKAVGLWQRYGAMNQTITSSDLDFSSSRATLTRASSLLDTANKISGFVFHQTERGNRHVTLQATFELDLAKKLNIKIQDLPAAFEKNKINPAMIKKSAKVAFDMVERTNGGNLTTTAPRFAQSDIGKIVFLFKRFGITMTHLIYEGFRKSFRGTKEERKTAIKQMMGIYGASALFSGVQGVPLFSAYAYIANMFKEDDEEDFETATRIYLGELGYIGIGSLVNIDVSTRISLNNLIYRRPMFDQGYPIYIDAAVALAGPVLGVTDSFVRGAVDFAGGEYYRGIEAMSPAAVRSILKAVRFSEKGEGGALTRTGNPIHDDFSTYSLFMLGMGFNQADYSKQTQINQKIMKINKDNAKERTRLTTQYTTAQKLGDKSREDFLGRQIDKFNKTIGVKYPDMFIGGETLIRSRKTMRKKDASLYHGVPLDPRMERELRTLAESFGGSPSLVD